MLLDSRASLRSNEHTSERSIIYFQMADSRCLTQEKEDLLRKKTPQLMKWVTTSKYFWAVMAKYDVLTRDALSSIQVSNLTKTDVNVINVILYHCTICTCRKVVLVFMLLLNQTFSKHCTQESKHSSIKHVCNYFYINYQFP